MKIIRLKNTIYQGTRCAHCQSSMLERAWEAEMEPAKGNWYCSVTCYRAWLFQFKSTKEDMDDWLANFPDFTDFDKRLLRSMAILI